MSIGTFIYIRRQQANQQLDEMTEGEEHYYKMRALRISIRKAEKKLKHPDEVEKLRSDMNKVKTKYVTEFLSYLHKKVYFKN